MTENQSDEVQRPEGAHECVLWFFDNITFGHLDEVPSKHLAHCIVCPDMNVKCCHIVVSGLFCPEGQTEDPVIFAHAANSHRVVGIKNLHYFNLWCVLELGRRMKLIDFELPDVLVKDMARDKTFYDSKPLSTWTALAKLIASEIGKRKDL